MAGSLASCPLPLGWLGDGGAIATGMGEVRWILPTATGVGCKGDAHPFYLTKMGGYTIMVV